MAAPITTRTIRLGLICLGVAAAVLFLYLSQFMPVAVWFKGKWRELPPSIYTFFHQKLPEPLHRSENAFNDYLVRAGQKAPTSKLLFAIGIDDASTSINDIDFQDFTSGMDPEDSDYRALSLMAHAYPWSRELYGLVLDKLIKAGARVVMFDMLFESETPRDESFRSILEKYRDQVVVGSNFVGLTEPNKPLSWTQTMPSDSLIPQVTPVDSRIGYVNFWPDPDDSIVRSAIYQTTQEALKGKAFAKWQQVFESLSTRSLKKANLGVVIPQDREAHFLHFTDPEAQELKPRPLYQLFVPRHWHRNYRDGAVLKGKIVIVGPYAEIFHDNVATPFGSLPGPHMHLQAANAVLQNAYISLLPVWGCVVMILAAALLAYANGYFFHKPLPQTLSLIGSNGIFLTTSWVIYNHFDTYPITVAPLLALNGGGLLSIIYQFVIEQVERARTRKTLERYVSRNLVSELLDNRKEFLEASMGKRKPVTVLFSDLRGFTSMTENTDPLVLVKQLNEYLTEMVRCVFAHHGTLDKFIGDAVMAVWGNVRSRGDAEDARLAILSALDMRTGLAILNKKWLESGLKEFRFGIGLNHGDVITGDIGSPEKSEFTVIGDPINLASRMEGLTKNYGVDILIGEDVAELIRNQFLLQSIDRVRVKGKGEPTEVFAVHQKNDIPVDEVLGDYLDQFANGLQLYRAALFAEAKERFAYTLSIRPDDPVTRVYLDRCEEFIAEPPESNWDGVFTMKTK